MDRMFDRLRIGIVGLTDGAGAGFLASSLARWYVTEESVKPTVVELGKTNLYDSLGMEKHFAESGFFSCQEQAVLGRSLRFRGNFHLGVNWLLMDKEEDLAFNHRLRLLSNSRGDLILILLSGIPEEELLQILPELDVLLLVIDPLPSCLIKGRSLFLALNMSEQPVIHIVNKRNHGIDERELKRYLGINRPIYLPFVPIEAVYSAEYSCRTVYDVPNAKEILKDPLLRIAKAIKERIDKF